MVGFFVTLLSFVKEMIVKKMVKFEIKIVKDFRNEKLGGACFWIEDVGECGG